MRHSIKLLMCSALIGIVGGCSKAIPKPRLGAPFALSEAHLQAIKLGAAKDLKDPYSAMLERVQATRDPGGVITVCGFINGKNSFGAYVGAKPFVGGLEDYTDSKTKKATREFHLGAIGSDPISADIVIDQCHAAGIVF